MTKQDFLRELLDAVDSCGSLVVCNRRVLAAQAILESGWGQSDLSKRHHNYFGIKAGGDWKGAKATYNTREFIDGKERTFSSEFRSYKNIRDGLFDYINFIATSPYFADALRYPDDDSAYLDVLVGGHIKYATDPNYKKLVLDIIETSDIKKRLS